MKIPLSQCRSGMMLSEDIIVSGGVLVNRNELLDDDLIRLLGNCDISEVDVCDTASREEEPRLNRVRHTPENEVMDTPVTAASSPEDALEIPPEISVLISPDKMTATLILDPDLGNSPIITVSHILSALNRASVAHGVQMSTIETAVEHWHHNRSRYEVTIATGTQPHDANERLPQMLTKALSSRSEADRVRVLKTAFDVHKQFPDVAPVPTGTVIAERSAESTAANGMDVTGRVMCAYRAALQPLNAGENTGISGDGNRITAQCTGIPFSIDGNIGIVPIEIDGAFTLEIASDNMTVRCKVTPPGPEGQLPGKVVLLNMLKSASVHEGVSDTAIDALITDCAQENYPAEPVIIAQGIPAASGGDGSVTLHFKTETSLAPQIGSDGNADYKAVNIVVTAEKDKLLANLVPPGAGVDGHDVLGRVLPSQAGKPAKLPAGPHTVIDPDDPSRLLAGIDGIVRLTGGLVEMCEGFLVEGDVDFSTGNINYAKTVTVAGDIKSGFTVHTGGDLQVNGTIEDSHVSTGGNILCKCGFIGSGKGIIESKGDVNLNFVKNQTVKSFKTITIAKEALNSYLFSRNAIIVHGKPLSVAGGELHAKHLISVYTAGNHTGIKTLLEVGVDYLMIDELTMIKEQITETMAHFKLVSDSFIRYQRAFTEKKPGPQELLKLKKLKDDFKQARQKLSVLEERKSIISGKLYTVDDARIVIEHAAYAGTLLKFGDRHHYLQEELIGPKTILYTNHEITIH